MWAIKIFDDGAEDFNLGMLDMAKKWGAGIECALYSDKGMPESVNARLKSEFANQAGHALGLHLSHSKLSLLELASQVWDPLRLSLARRIASRADPMSAPLEPEDAFLSPAAIRLAREAGWAKGAGARDAVVHFERGGGGAGAWHGLKPEACALACAPAIHAASDLGLRLHMEKTHESRAWLDAFFKQVEAQGQADQFGFTFDLGHSRVWEREPLEGWMESIAQYDAWGFGLHFHLHGNPGDADRHDTLSLAQSMGWLEPDPEWAPNGAMPILYEIQRLYEHKALLVLETGPERALENLGWVELAMR
jgi:hypothetical protein